MCRIEPFSARQMSARAPVVRLSSPRRLQQGEERKDAHPGVVNGSKHSSAFAAGPRGVVACATTSVSSAPRAHGRQNAPRADRLPLPVPNRRTVSAMLHLERLASRQGSSSTRLIRLNRAWHSAASPFEPFYSPRSQYEREERVVSEWDLVKPREERKGSLRPTQVLPLEPCLPLSATLAALPSAPAARTRPPRPAPRTPTPSSPRGRPSRSTQSTRLTSGGRSRALATLY